MPSSRLILCRPLLLLLPIPPSIRVFSNESTLRMRWPKYWSFSFSIIPSKEIPVLISFRMDWFIYLLLCNKSKSEIVSHSVVSNSLQCHGLYPARVLCLWNSPGKNTGEGSHSLLQGIFMAQGSNPSLLHCRQILDHLSHQGSPLCNKIPSKSPAYFDKHVLSQHKLRGSGIQAGLGCVVLA